MSWEKIYGFKNCYPVNTAEYAITQDIDHKPAFNWWVRHTLKKRDRIISFVQKRQTRHLNKNHKFGIGLPKTFIENHYPDKKIGNTLWDNEISKEMKNMKIDFYIMSDGERVLNGYNQIRCHMIFDVKMEDFRRKEILVADEHVIEMTKYQTYSSVVLHDNFRLALNIATLNELQDKAGGAMNSYATAPINKKV